MHLVVEGETITTDLHSSLLNFVIFLIIIKDNIMWTQPVATEMRFGFEVTMYVCNR